MLSPLLFIVVMEALSLEFREGLPMELLYADDLILMAESREQLVERIKIWKNKLEGKGLRVNVGKSKVMRCHVGDGEPEVSGEFPCVVYKKELVQTRFNACVATNGCTRGVVGLWGA